MRAWPGRVANRTASSEPAGCWRHWRAYEGYWRRSADEKPVAWLAKGLVAEFLKSGVPELEP
jgi:hypothetical protein